MNDVVPVTVRKPAVFVAPNCEMFILTLVFGTIAGKLIKGTLKRFTTKLKNAVKKALLTKPSK